MEYAFYWMLMSCEQNNFSLCLPHYWLSIGRYNNKEQRPNRAAVFVGGLSSKATHHRSMRGLVD